MAAKKVDEVVVKVPQGVRTVRIEIDGTKADENVSIRTSRKKICD